MLDSIPKIPKSMANQSVVFNRKSTETDDYDRHIPGEKITINNVVVQEDPIYSGTNNNREIQANAVIFVYAGVSNPLPTITQDDIGSKISFEKADYTLKKVVVNRHPFSNDIWSYELEVL